MSKDKVTLSPSDISEKWNRRMKGAVSDIQKGIDAVTSNPCEKAADKSEKMLANITQAVTSGKWGNALRKVTTAEWKQKTKDKVGSRLASGVDAAMTKRQEFDKYLANTLNQVLPEINNMPDMTLEDSVNRCRRLFEHMANNPYKK